MKDSLHVKASNHPCGTLTREGKEFIFNYTTEEKSSFISLTMPVRVKSYINDKLHPIFEMNLPEGYLLSVIKKHFSKIEKIDDFALLKLMAQSINARVTYTSNTKEKQVPLSLSNLLHPESANLFSELVERFALSSPLSGVQPKVLAQVSNKATLSLEEYIVKSWGNEYPQLALNEYFCMSALKYANLTVPEFYISDDYKLFIMKRFDSKDDGSYLGFEDMCVLQAKNAEDKYEGSYERIAKSIKIFVSPKHKKNSLLSFFKMVVLNTLLQNGDAHLKNFGLIYDSIEDIKLAPAYDVVCTTLYIKNDIPALHLLGSKKWWGKKYLLRFGVESCDLSQHEAKQSYDECVSAIFQVNQEIQSKIKNEPSLEIQEFLSELQKKFQIDKEI